MYVSLASRNRIMTELAIPPGPLVGEAYRYLLELRMEHGPAWPEPDQARIAILLRRLAKDNFAILQRADGQFVQAVGRTGGGYVIEYQDGDLSRHYATETSDLAEVIDVFQDFADGGQTWLQQHNWKPLRL